MSRRILLADDEADLRMMVRLMLRRAGFDVTEVADGLEALETLADERFDAVLLDNRMPGMTGLEVAAQLRADGYDGPVLIFSGYLDTAARCEAERIGARTLPKVDVERLVAAVAEMLGADEAP